MEYEQRTNEWYIPHLDDNIDKEDNMNNMLAMGFNDDEECKLSY
jgi:hypothetical protein